MKKKPLRASPAEVQFKQLVHVSLPSSSQEVHINWFVSEHPFHIKGMLKSNDKRFSFRFDFAWPNMKIAVEIQSHQWHRTKMQLERDRWKLNMAMSEGWILFQFSPWFVNTKPEVVVSLIRKSIRCRSNN